tara:strand:- start:7875 stop:8120 length:246 start_codon:yes stop_codon:yes gene_type:complete
MMTCMTTKKKFEVLQPEVTVLRNGRYAFRAECPWEGKNGKKLVAFKFCSSKDYQAQCDRLASASESEHPAESELHSDTEAE